MVNRRFWLVRPALAAVLLLACWGPTPSRAQTALDALFFSERLPGTGTRLSALGGASIAGVGDYGALYSNPAGLGYAESSEATGTFQALLVNDEASYTTSFQQAVGEDFSSTTSRSGQVRTGYGLDSANLIYKVPTQRGSLVFGVGTNVARSFDRSVDFANRNQRGSFESPTRGSSITDTFRPLNDEVSVDRFAPGESPSKLLLGEVVVRTDSADYLLDFDPDGGRANRSIERPLSFIAFKAFGIDFDPAAYDSTAGPASGFLPVVPVGTQFKQSGSISESGTLREWNVGAAVEAGKDLMLGLSANIVSGSREVRDSFEEVDDNDEAIGFNELRVTRRRTSELTGFNLRVGLSYDGPSFRAGFSVETPTWYSARDETSTQMRTIFDNGDRFAYGDDDTENVGRTESEYTINTPWRIGVGGALRVADATLLADVVFVDWTGLQLGTSEDRGAFDEENQLIDDHFRPVVNTRLGVEYDLAPLTVRAGFAYQPSPVSLSDVGPEASGLDLQGADEVNERTRSHFSVGLGYRFSERLHLDLAWTHERFEDRFTPYVAPKASYVNEDVVRNRIQAGLRYAF